ncbi:MAG TPA: hypothetical protein VMR70_17405 [Flavisolibacter sp.]|nr:hypothetical protein [Flavisolibacter sp.]
MAFDEMAANIFDSLLLVFNNEFTLVIGNDANEILELNRMVQDAVSF